MTTQNPKPKPKVKQTRRGSARTPEGQKNFRKKHSEKKLQYLKRSLNREQKKLEKISSVDDALDPSVPTSIVEDDSFDYLPDDYAKEVNQKIIFKANEGPQTDFLVANEREVFFGGSRGGGKSFALIVDPLRYCNMEEHRAVIIRRTMPELRDLIAKSQQLYPKAIPGAKWRESEKLWRFPSGARIEFGYAEQDQDLNRYIGQNYTWIGVDELPHFPDRRVLDILRGSLRSTNPELPVYLRASGNPGSVGSGWVKEEFIDPAPPNTRFYKDIKIETPLGVIEDSISKRFIPSTVFDNPYLLHDNSYIASLASLPETLRKQWLEGNWDVFDNSAFPEFDRNIHVIDPIQPHNNWTLFRAADWGYSTPACCLWFAVDQNNTLIIYRELYGSGMTADVFAKKVLQMENENREAIRYGILDSSTWHTRGDVGPTIAETMIKEGCNWRPSDRSKNSRIAGKIELHRRLSTTNMDGSKKEPALKITKNCVNLIKELTSLQLDSNNVEDVDTKQTDHAYDALRYGCMSRPINHIDASNLEQFTLRQNSFEPADKVLGY